MLNIKNIPNTFSRVSKGQIQPPNATICILSDPKLMTWDEMEVEARDQDGEDGGGRGEGERAKVVLEDKMSSNSVFSINV